jgi:fermentation-respiration switch protein FrsA (DUF1100 family)
MGLAGHSEGGVIAPIVAARSNAVAFIVLLAGSGLTGGEINLLQVEALLPEHTKGQPAARKALIQAQGALMAALAKGTKEPELKALLNTALDAGMALVSEEDRAALTPETRAAQVEGQYRQLTSPWFRSFVVTDPAEALRKTKVPVLALIGEKDLQVPAGPNLAAIGAALKAGGNSDFEVHQLPRLNHLFQTAETGRLSEYGTLSETFNPDALALITRWLRAKARLEMPGTP